MIKRALLIACFFSFAAFSLQAQNCIATQDFPADAIAVPASWSPARLDQGITDTACIGQYFEFTLSVKTPAVLPVLNIPVSSIALPPQNGISNLPAGMTYTCEPPNCVFPRDSFSCIKLFGTPTDPDDVGQHDLSLSLTINLFPAGQLPNIPYPNEQLDPGGHYYLQVKPAGSNGCFVSSTTSEEGASAFSAIARPNPTTGFTQIAVQSAQSGMFDFQISDMTGRSVHRERVPLYAGENTLHYDGSMLPAGMYVYSLSNGSETVTHKLVISRN